MFYSVCVLDLELSEAYVVADSVSAEQLDCTIQSIRQANVIAFAIPSSALVSLQLPHLSTRLLQADALQHFQKPA